MTHDRPMRLAAQLVLATSTAWLLTACATADIPTAQMAVAEAAVERASNSNTSENAAGRLQIAVSKLSAARLAMVNKDYLRARRLADEVAVDAQLAELHAQSVRTGVAAQESEDAERALREEINRKTTY